MPMLIIGGPGEDKEERKPMKSLMSAKKFEGIGGKYASEEPEENEDEATTEGSTGVKNAQMFLDAVKGGNARRTLEAFKALVQYCADSGKEE